LKNKTKLASVLKIKAMHAHTVRKTHGTKIVDK